jgi:hypothetical protein
MTSRRGDLTPRVGPRVGRAARASAVLGVLGAGGLAGCGETRALILGEVPSPDAGLVVGTVPDAGLGEDAAIADAGCAACTLPVDLGDATSTSEQGGPTGTAYTDTCPSGQAVVGYQGFLTAPSVGLTLVGGIQAICGALVVSESPPYALTTGPGVTLPLRGTSQTSPWTQMCPSDQIVVAFDGNSGVALDQVTFLCAPWSASSGVVGATLSMGAQVALPPVGGDGGMPFQDSCPAGQLAIGSTLRSGQWVDAFGLVCGTPVLAGPADAGP